VVAAGRKRLAEAFGGGEAARQDPIGRIH